MIGIGTPTSHRMIERIDANPLIVSDEDDGATSWTGQRFRRRPAILLVGDAVDDAFHRRVVRLVAVE